MKRVKLRGEGLVGYSLFIDQYPQETHQEILRNWGIVVFTLCLEHKLKVAYVLSLKFAL